MCGLLVVLCLHVVLLVLLWVSCFGFLLEWFLIMVINNSWITFIVFLILIARRVLIVDLFERGISVVAFALVGVILGGIIGGSLLCAVRKH